MIGEVLNQTNNVSEAAQYLSENYDHITYPSGRNIVINISEGIKSWAFGDSYEILSNDCLQSINFQEFLLIYSKFQFQL